MPRGAPGVARANRPIRIEGDIAFITLTKGYVAVIDASDVPLVEGLAFHVDIHPKVKYAKTRIARRPARLHQIIMGFPAHLIDHADTDGLNCRRYNLRLTDHSGNKANRRVQSNSVSGIKGVRFHRQSGLWSVTLKKNGVKIGPKYFKSQDEAAAGYAELAAEIHGEFARS